MTWLFETMLSVVPSGADLTRADVPTMPPAPAWFSTMTGAPSAFDSAGVAARVIVSTPDAVATGRMNLIGRSLCAHALQAASAPTSAKPMMRTRETRLRRCGDGGLLQSFVTRLLSFRGLIGGRVARGDGTLRDEFVDRAGRVTDVAQQFAHVLADFRRIEAYAETTALHRDRKQRRPHRLASSVAIGKSYVGEATGGVQ